MLKCENCNWAVWKELKIEKQKHSPCSTGSFNSKKQQDTTYPEARRYKHKHKHIPIYMQLIDNNNRGIILSEVVDEVMDVMVDLIWSFLVEEMASSLYHNNILKQWHIFLEPTPMYIFLDSRCGVHHVNIPNHELHWNFHFHPCPCCC